MKYEKWDGTYFLPFKFNESIGFLFLNFYGENIYVSTDDYYNDIILLNFQILSMIPDACLACVWLREETFVAHE